MYTNLNELKEGLFDAIVPLMTRPRKVVKSSLGRDDRMTTDVNDIEIFFDLIINYLETLDVKSMGDNIVSDPIMLELARDKPFSFPPNSFT